MADLSKAAAEHLAAFLAAVRPPDSRWDAPGTVKALGDATRRPDRPDAFQIAVAAVRAAAEPTNRTPAIIPRDGAHWRPPTPDQIPTPDASVGRRCPRCPAWTVPGDGHECTPAEPTADYRAARAHLRQINVPADAEETNTDA